MARELPLGTSVFTGSPAPNRNPGTFEARAADLARRRRYAELLQAQALKEGDGAQMVSGHYIANPWNALGKMAMGLMGSIGAAGADRDEQALAGEREDAFRNALDRMPQSRTEMRATEGSPDYQMEPPTPVTTNPTPQDWMRWGGEMSQLGPQGQAIGQTAITQGLGSMFKVPAVPDYEKIEIPAANGMKQLAYINKRDPTKPPIPVGQPFAAEHKPSALDQRVAYAEELSRLYAVPANQRSAAQNQRIDTLNTALSQNVLVPTADGGVLAGTKSGVNSSGAGAPGAAPAPSVSPSVPGASVPGLAKVEPGVQAERDRQGLALKKQELAAAAPGSAEHAALTTEIAQTEEKIRKNEVLAAQTEGDDVYAPYRADPRNAQYLPRGTPVGMKALRAGTGNSAKLNEDVAKLGKTVVDNNIPEFETAWANFESALRESKAARSKESEKSGTRTAWERAMDIAQFGEGVGGPMGVYNALPTFLTSEAGRRLRIATGQVKAFQRHALFGATLTNNERQSFEEVAGTLFGMDTGDFEAAMAQMRAGFERKKADVYSGFAPIVVDAFQGRFGGGMFKQTQGTPGSSQPTGKFLQNARF